MSKNSFDLDQQIVMTTFRLIGSFASGTSGGSVTNSEIDLSPPNWGARGIAFADLYQKYRITYVNFRGWAFPGQNNTATQAVFMPGNCSYFVAAYYGPKSTFTAPSSITNFVDFPHLHWMTDGGRSVLNMEITERDLRSHQSIAWYQTAPTGSADPDNVQLCIELLNQPNLTTTSAAMMNFTIDLTVEFTGSVDPALIPSRARALRGETKQEDVKQSVQDDFVHLAPTGLKPSPRENISTIDLARLTLARTFVRVQQKKKRQTWFIKSKR